MLNLWPRSCPASLAYTVIMAVHDAMRRHAVSCFCCCRLALMYIQGLCDLRMIAYDNGL